jgi:hypothetical protein
MDKHVETSSVKAYTEDTSARAPPGKSVVGEKS